MANAWRTVFTQAGKADFDFLYKKAIEWGEPKVPSAKQVSPVKNLLLVGAFISIFLAFFDLINFAFVHMNENSTEVIYLFIFNNNAKI